MLNRRTLLRLAGRGAVALGVGAVAGSAVADAAPDDDTPQIEQFVTIDNAIATYPWNGGGWIMPDEMQPGDTIYVGSPQRLMVAFRDGDTDRA